MQNKIQTQSQYKVIYVGYKNTDIISGAQIKPYNPPPLSSLTPGRKCLAVYSADGNFYDATIEKVTQNQKAVWVTFSGYGNIEEVPLEMIILLSDEKNSSSTTSSEAKATAGDSKFNKKRGKPDGSGSAGKKERTEGGGTTSRSPAAISQSSWQNFLQKQKPEKTFRSGLIGANTSMFKSPDTVEGKVGVVKSASGPSAAASAASGESASGFTPLRAGPGNAALVIKKQTEQQ